MCSNVGSYADYIKSAVEYICAMWEVYVLGTYASNVQCMYTHAPSNTLHCSGLIWGLYMDICLICTHKVIGICGTFMASEGTFAAGTYMDVTL